MLALSNQCPVKEFFTHAMTQCAEANSDIFSYLIDHKTISRKMGDSIVSVFKQLSSPDQERLVRIAIHQDHDPAFLFALIDAADFSDEQKESFDGLRSERNRVAALRERILTQNSFPSHLLNTVENAWARVSVFLEQAGDWISGRRVVDAHFFQFRTDRISFASALGYKLKGLDPWHIKTTQEIMEHGAEIRAWVAGRYAQSDLRNSTRFKYFESYGAVGQIQALPHLILKIDLEDCFVSPRGKRSDRLDKINRILDVMNQSNITHIRMPKALRVFELPDIHGVHLPVKSVDPGGCDLLIVEEKLPIAGHEAYEVKELLEELNRDEKTKSVVNRYFEELTRLVCKTGLSDLKATNVPLMEDGSGLALIDSNMQDRDPLRSLYAFPQPNHSLIDWLAPDNFIAISRILQTDPSCPSGLDTAKYENQRMKSYQEEQELRRFHLEQYGNVFTSPIVLSERDLEDLDPAKHKSCMAFIEELNRILKSDENHGELKVFRISSTRRNIGYLGYGLENLFKRIGVENHRAFDEILDFLISKRKVLSKEYAEGHGHLFLQC